MICPNCKKTCGDDLHTCPYCRRPLDVRSTSAKKRKKKSRAAAPLLISGIGILLIVAIIVGAVYFLPEKVGPTHNSFAEEITSVDPESSNHTVLTVFSAAYESISHPDKYHCEVTIDPPPRKPSARMVLDLVKKDRYTIEELYTVGMRTICRRYGVKNEEIPSLNEAYELVGKFLAEMPEDLVEIREETEGDRTKYTYSFCKQNAALEFLDFIENNDQVQPILEGFVRHNYGRDYTVSDWLRDKRDELYAEEKTLVTGVALVEDGALRDLTGDTGNHDFRVRFIEEQ